MIVISHIVNTKEENKLNESIGHVHNDSNHYIGNNKSVRVSQFTILHNSLMYFGLEIDLNRSE